MWIFEREQESRRSPHGLSLNNRLINMKVIHDGAHVLSHPVRIEEAWVGYRRRIIVTTLIIHNDPVTIREVVKLLASDVSVS